MHGFDGYGMQLRIEDLAAEGSIELSRHVHSATIPPEDPAGLTPHDYLAISLRNSRSFSLISAVLLLPMRISSF